MCNDLIEEKNNSIEKKEFVVAVKEVHIAYVAIEAEDEKDAIRKVIAGEGIRGEDLDKCGFLHPKTWEVFEL